jgi:hypothetical protein
MEVMTAIGIQKLLIISFFPILVELSFGGS